MKILTLLLFVFSASFAFAAGDEWNSTENRAAILESLATTSATFQCKFDCKHEVVGEFAEELNSGKKVVIVTSSIDPQSQCHACSPELSLFIFSKTNNQWKRESALLAFTNWGSWGVVGDESVAIKKLNSDQLGLFLEGGYTGQGYFSAILQLHLIANDALKQIFRYCTAASNSGAVGEDSKNLEDWESTFELLPVADALADIKVSLVDNISGEKSTSVFSYDGMKYIASKADPRLVDECS
ncbi:MAG: hypothetical protein L3J32_04145 [Rhizobiaceae bacterium]|nr:hypothetical protein [Rhizobiaceae bacterium]